MDWELESLLTSWTKLLTKGTDPFIIKTYCEGMGSFSLAASKFSSHEREEDVDNMDERFGLFHCHVRDCRDSSVHQREVPDQMH
jgi:hypothetical protein